MKAFIVKRYGKKENLHLSEIAVPAINENDVLVQIYASSVNLLDSKIRNGEFKFLLPYKTPFTLGHDVAGVVTRIGSNVKNFKIGDEVYARPSADKIGTFAEFISINESDLALKPKNLSMEEAASIPLIGLTVWQAFVEKANLQKGQKVLIQAGSGGVGTFAIQMAKHLGCTVATTTSAENFDLVKSLGADIVIDYKKEDFETLLKDYDFVLNSQDALTLEKSLSILKPGGQIISISGPPDITFAKQFKLSWIFRLIMRMLSRDIRRKAKQKEVKYSFLFMRAHGDQLSRITELIESGIIQPVIDKVFSFDQTNEALKYVENGRSRGKVIIKVK